MNSSPLLIAYMGYFQYGSAEAAFHDLDDLFDIVKLYMEFDSSIADMKNLEGT